MVPASVPPDIARFIEQEIAGGRYGSEDELVIDAVRILRELKERHRSLCDDIQHGIRDLEESRCTELDSDGELRQFLDEIKAEGRRRLANDEN